MLRVTLIRQCTFLAPVQDLESRKNHDTLLTLLSFLFFLPLTGRLQGRWVFLCLKVGLDVLGRGRLCFVKVMLCKGAHYSGLTFGLLRMENTENL